MGKFSRHSFRILWLYFVFISQWIFLIASSRPITKLFDYEGHKKESYWREKDLVTWVYIKAVLNPLTTGVSHHIETNQLICRANQLTGFYMMGNISRQCVNITTESRLESTGPSSYAIMEGIAVIDVGNL